MIFGAVALASATCVAANSNKSSLCLATLQCKRQNGASDASKISGKPSMIDSASRSQGLPFKRILEFVTKVRNVGDSVLYHLVLILIISQEFTDHFREMAKIEKSVQVNSLRETPPTAFHLKTFAGTGSGYRKPTGVRRVDWSECRRSPVLGTECRVSSGKRKPQWH